MSNATTLMILKHFIITVDQGQLKWTMANTNAGSYFNKQTGGLHYPPQTGQ